MRALRSQGKYPVPCLYFPAWFPSVNTSPVVRFSNVMMVVIPARNRQYFRSDVSNIAFCHDFLESGPLKLIRNVSKLLEMISKVVSEPQNLSECTKSHFFGPKSLKIPRKKTRFETSASDAKDWVWDHMGVLEGWRVPHIRCKRPDRLRITLRGVGLELLMAKSTRRV